MPVSAANSLWNEERVQILRDEWDKGTTTAKIAAILNCGLTRNAVIGKARRLGLASGSNEWSDSDLDELKRLWEQHLSANQIAAALTRRNASGQPMSRQAVLRMANKLGLHRPKPPKRQRTSGPRIVKPYVQPAKDFEIPFEQRKTLFELGPRDCRWPVGDPGSAEFFFCGAPKMGEQSYCAEHHRRAHEYYRPTGVGFNMGWKPRVIQGGLRSAYPEQTEGTPCSRHSTTAAAI